MRYDVFPVVTTVIVVVVSGVSCYAGGDAGGSGCVGNSGDNFSASH